MFPYLVILCTTLLLLYWFQTKRKGQQSKMASPKGYPIIGPILELSKMADRPHIVMEKWAKELGDIYDFYIFGRRIVVLNSVDVIYEALVKKGKQFSGRDPTWRLSCLFGDNKGGVLDIVLSDPNTAWAKKRKVAQKSLKMFGEGMTRIQDLSLQYVSLLVQRFREHRDEAFDPREYVKRVITGMMYTLSLGVYIDDQSPDIVDALNMEHMVSIALNIDADGLLLDELPFLRYFGVKRSKEVSQCSEMRNTLFKRLLKDIKANINQDVECDRGLADALYRAQGEFGKDMFSDEAIYAVLTDMTAGGVETSATTFCAMLHLLAVHPDVQAKAYDEISRVLGDRDYPKLTDKEHMPYCRAVVLETTRYFTTVPLLLPHCTTEDAEIAGHSISKGTLVLMNAWAAQHDDTYWDKPYSFLPQRFIDPSGNLVLSDHPCRKGVLTFGAGAKACIGEVLAINRLFLFLVTILRHFDLHPDPADVTSASFDVSAMPLETVLKTKPYKIRAKERH